MLDSKKLVHGEVLSRYSVITIIEGPYKKNPLSKDLLYLVRNEYGEEWEISATLLEKECYSSIQYIKEEKITRTDMEKIITEAGDTVFQVTFYKKVEAKEIVKKVVDAIKNGESGWVQDLAKWIVTGDKRVMTARLARAERELGRFMVYDLDIKLDTEAKNDNRIRLVDPRTMESLIYKNTYYTLK